MIISLVSSCKTAPLIVDYRTMVPDIKNGLTKAYDKRNFQAGPKTYSDPSLIDKILVAGRLLSLPPGSHVADLMSGPGKLGLAIEDALREKDHRFFYLDASASQLSKVPDAPHREKVVTDIRQAELSPETFDVAVARYAVKDLPEGEQEKALRSVYSSIRPGGRLVLVDMIAPTEQLQPWTIGQHALKQEYGGRNHAVEGRCHIRTNEGWNKVLELAGFYPAVMNSYVSEVNTRDWLNSGQVDHSQLAELNRHLVNAPAEAKAAFNIRESAEGVQIDYPVAIIAAWKRYTKDE